MARLLSIGKFTLFGICVLYLSLMLIGFGFYFFVTVNRSFVDLIKTIFVLCLWLSLPVLLLTLGLRAWPLVAVAGLMFAVFVWIYHPYLLPRNPDVPADLPRLTLMTFNIKATSEGLLDAIRSADADIVALQELNMEAAQTVEALLSLYPYQRLHPQSEDEFKGQGIISRFPILEDDYWEYPDVPFTLGHQRVEVEFEGARIIIYNTHPWPPLVWESGYDDESHRLVMEDILRRTDGEDGPLLILGDFNMTDHFSEYHQLRERYTDSYRVAGDGMGYTYPNFRFRPFPSLLRLDYIWHNADFITVDSVVWPEHGASDHSPVRSVLAFNPRSDD